MSINETFQGNAPTEIETMDTLPEGVVLWPTAWGLVGPFAAFATIGLFVQPVLALLAKTGFPGWLMWAVAGVLVAGVVIVGARLLRSRGRIPRSGRGSGGQKVSSGAVRLGRITLVGSSQDLSRSITLAKVDEAFEPIVLRSWSNHQSFRMGQAEPGRHQKIESHSGDSDPRARKATFAIVVVALIGKVVFFHYRGLTLGGRTAPQFYEYMGAVAAAKLVVGWLRPKYIRLAPGRVDVMQWSFLGLGKPVCRCFDLKSAELVIMPKARIARIHDAKQEDPYLTIRWFPDEIDGRHLAASLVQAARSRYPTPPLSTESLV
jgi:hypothetical protein